MTTATSDLSRLFARQVAERRLDLPAMPGPAAEVLQLCQQDDTDAAKLSQVIHRDPVIASHVLRVANSAAYGAQVPCASLQQAVGRLGMQVITDIAVAASVKARMFANPGCADLLAALWKHSVLAGFFTKEIARLRRRNVEIAFLCGLLHDIGKAVLLDNVDRVLRSDQRPPQALLIRAVHEHHVEAGELLAAEWRLPDQIAEAIRCHHAFAAAGRFADMAMTVCLADLLSHHVAPSPFAEPPSAEDLARHPVLEGLNLYRDQFHELLGKRDQALLVVESMR